jgi:hypothetical protein
MTTAQTLRDAAALVDRGWCQGAFARNSTGHVVSWSGDTGVAFSLSGAILHANILTRSDGLLTHCGDFVRAVIDFPTPDFPLDSWNNTEGRTAHEVVAALLRAAELAEAGGSNV